MTLDAKFIWPSDYKRFSLVHDFLLRSSFMKFLILQILSSGTRASIFSVGWLVGFGFNGPLRQYFSLYRAVSQREEEIGKKG